MNIPSEQLDQFKVVVLFLVKTSFVSIIGAMTRLLSYSVSLRKYMNPIFSFMNMDEMPRPVHVGMDYSVASAWIMTGNYIRKAMNEYGSSAEFRDARHNATGSRTASIRRPANS